MLDDRALPSDLNGLSKRDVSSRLFGTIAWNKIMQSGVFLDHKKVGAFHPSLMAKL